MYSETCDERPPHGTTESFIILGNLYFANVKLSDQVDKRKYVLSVRNPLMSTTIEGSDKILLITPGKSICSALYMTGDFIPDFSIRILKRILKTFNFCL